MRDFEFDFNIRKPDDSNDSWTENVQLLLKKIPKIV